MTRRSSRPAGRATDLEVGVVAAVLITEPEKAAAHRLGLSHSTVKHRLANARSKLNGDGRARRYAERTLAEERGQTHGPPGAGSFRWSGVGSDVLTRCVVGCGTSIRSPSRRCPWDLSGPSPSIPRSPGASTSRGGPP
jgi:hypothetical protein